MKKGIDVSRWQGTIDWAKVKKAGIDFAILRCGYGGDDEDQDDTCFVKNANACEKVKMPYGVYLYSYAKTVKDAKSEAAHVLRLVKGRKLEYPIYYDLEDANTTGKCSNGRILEIAKAFVTTLEKEGYYVGIYANKYWNVNYLTDKWYDTKPRWVAQYNTECTYKGEYGMWQYTSTGKVNGINGNVDMNYVYVDYPAIIKTNGKNGFKKAESTTKVNKATVTKKSTTTIAKEVLAGKWGNGETRKKKLTKAGYLYDAVQKEVNKLLSKSTKKSNTTVAKEVIAGKWGNGEARKKKLAKAGYSYDAVQKEVNKLLSKS